MTNERKTQCGTCEKTVRDDDISIHCDGVCERRQHKECTGMTSGEFDILKRKNCKLLWLCNKCNHELIKKEVNDCNKLETLSMKADSIIDFLENKLAATIEGKIKYLRNEERPPVIKRVTEKERNIPIERTKTGKPAAPQPPIHSESQAILNDTPEMEQPRTMQDVTPSSRTESPKREKSSRPQVVIGSKQDEDLQGEKKTGLAVRRKTEAKHHY